MKNVKVVKNCLKIYCNLYNRIQIFFVKNEKNFIIKTFINKCIDFYNFYFLAPL